MPLIVISSSPRLLLYSECNSDESMKHQIDLLNLPLPAPKVRLREPLRDVRRVHVRDGDAGLRHPLLEEEGALRPHHTHRHGRGKRQQRLVQVGVPRR